MTPEGITERLWPKVRADNKTGCWLWSGTTRRGYGLLRIGSRTDNTTSMASVHRLTWQLVHGPIPLGLCVLHRCDVRNCCRPEHLFLGTHADNKMDCIRKGRAAGPPHLTGEQNGTAKLTAGHVRAMRRRYQAGGITQMALAEQFGVHQSLVSLIVRRIRWQHLDGVPYA